MASAQQLIGLIKSHAEGDEDRFFDLAMQLAAAEAQKGHKRLAEQLRQWAEASKTPANRIGIFMIRHLVETALGLKHQMVLLSGGAGSALGMDRPLKPR